MNGVIITVYLLAAVIRSVCETVAGS